MFHCPIKSLCIEADLSGQEKDLVGSFGLTGRFALVCDPNTHDVMGQRLAGALAGADMVVLAEPRANETSAQDLMDRTRHADTLIAVGAGTLNDLCKYVSHRRNRPYLVFATAPSMNGYATATASISRDGEKLSLPATPPLGVFFDLGVLARAPARLIQAGVGDSLCRSTAEVDWFLSHHLLGTNFSEAPFALQTEAEASLLKQTSQLMQGDLGAMRALVRLLILGGMGMLLVGNSQPGSQGEHLISHYVDMFCDPHPGTLHGEQVGLATWTMAKLQESMLQQEAPPVLGETDIDMPSMKARYGKLSTACQKAIQAKAMGGRRLDLLNEQLQSLWPTLRKELAARSLPPHDLMAAFKTTGVKRNACDLGIDPVFYGEAVRHARELRDRFTTLDLAADTGQLAPFVDDHLQPMTPA